jgi:hypothetical protein
MASVRDISLKTIGDSIKNGAADLLSSSDFISRTIGMNNSYEDIMFIVQSLGREPISLLGKDYAFIYDHVRRNYLQGTYVDSMDYAGCYKFTFYKDPPTIRFANPYEDTMNLLDRWMPDVKFESTAMSNAGGRTSIHYSEANGGKNNIKIDIQTDLEYGNPGTATNSIFSYGPELTTCDLVKKTNDNFNYGKYDTLIARFHTDNELGRDNTNPTQTAISREYGMSHGRNLLKINDKCSKDDSMGYDNPYCRVWTYHHQYNQIKRQIRPFCEENTQEGLEKKELSGDYDTVGFRTNKSSNYGFDGGSKRLDTHGVLNYRNGTVNIAPTAKIKDYFDGKQSDYDKQIIETKKCMFSIENLAWRDDKSVKNEFDAYGLSPEQKGPLGGRIMWFPPYDLTFNESVNVDWNQNKFIGRGEHVYTYTNTERNGTLNFTLLIDHPSILDYWTGHKRNGMKNKGNGLAEGNSGGVDNKNNQENTLLRFFAGCDILTAKPHEYEVRQVTPERVPTPPEPPEPTPPEPEETEPEHLKMYAILYYPNNYSGKDDDVEFAINYLMYGVGTQKEVVYNATKRTGSTVDFQPIVNDPGAIGYEIKEGISQITWDKIKNELYYGVVNGNNNPQDPDFKVNNGVNEYILAEYYPYGNRSVMLAKQIGSTASKGKDSTSLTSEWKYKRWFYRVDKSTENQRLTGKPMNYLDQKCHKLNSSGYDWVKDNIKAFNLTNEDDLVAFADLYCALNEGATGLGENKANVERIKKMLHEEDGYKITKLTFRGHNSSHGRYQNSKTQAENNAVNASRNATLSAHRATTFKNWMAKMNFPMAAEADASKTLSETEESSSHKTDSVDSPYIKAWRSASVVIEYDKYEVSDAANAEDRKVAVDENGKPKTDKEGKVVSNLDRVEPKNTRIIGYTTNEKGEQVPIKEVLGSDNSSASGERNVMAIAQGQPFTYPTPDITKVSDINMKNRNGMDMNVKGVSPVGIISQPNLDITTAKLDNVEIKDPVYIRKSVAKRYDNEGEFFEALTEEAPFLHHLISEKIRYFDPAYHAISPEGFNARLTFLHQCTRQGATLENSKTGLNNTTAYNLAFGRPPICVLRLGDFYYTKIVITSLQINYDSPQWDMNPEGIGMMPMFAKITLGFHFLGGSDLAGPIARLQNAVSFNYYANTSVYDNRAEMVEYDPNGSGKEIKFKGFNYPSEYSGMRLNQGRLGEENEQGGTYAEDF